VPDGHGAGPVGFRGALRAGGRYGSAPSPQAPATLLQGTPPGAESGGSAQAVARGVAPFAGDLFVAARALSPPPPPPGRLPPFFRVCLLELLGAGVQLHAAAGGAVRVAGDLFAAAQVVRPPPRRLPPFFRVYLLELLGAGVLLHGALGSWGVGFHGALRAAGRSDSEAFLLLLSMTLGMWSSSLRTASASSATAGSTRAPATARRLPVAPTRRRLTILSVIRNGVWSNSCLPCSR